MKAYPFLIKLVSPLVHGDFNDGLDTGNFSGFRRMPCIGVDGEKHNIPVVSGNAIRGIMRRLLSWEYFQKTGIKSDKLYIAMANGGAIGKNLDTYIRPDVIQAYKNLFPVISAFGSALYTFMLPGVFNMSFAAPQCRELGTGDLPVGELVTDISQTRHIERTKAEYQVDGIEVKPMPYTIEAIISGAVLESRIVFLDAATDLDKATVFHGLNLLSGLGGKNAVGFGQIELSEKFDDSPYVEWLASLPEDYNNKALELIGKG